MAPCGLMSSNKSINYHGPASDYLRPLGDWAGFVTSRKIGRSIVAYWLMWSLRALMPKRSMWRVAQFDRLRLRLIKAAARVVEMKTMIRVQLPTSCTAQDILHLGRIPRLPDLWPDAGEDAARLRATDR